MTEGGDPTHIVEVAFECAAFDVALMRGGTASLVWYQAREFARLGHRVSIVTPAHGRVEYLRGRYGAEEVPPADAHVVPLVLDPAVWPGYPTEVALPLVTRAFRVRRAEVDIYFLSNGYLDLLPDELYPPNEAQGTDLAFFKPLVFQVAAIGFVERLLAEGPAVVQGYEPYFHYLLPPVLGGRPDVTTVSTVAANTPINAKVYRPQLDRLLRMFSVPVDLDRLADPVPGDPLATAMADYLRPSHLTHEPGPDYVTYFSLVAAHVDLIDFVSPGQRHYYSTFRDAPSERWFERLTVARIVRETAHKQFVGGCALPAWWLDRDPDTVDRAEVLAGLGLDPNRPTFYHAARYAPNHKGQVELFRAVAEVLRDDGDVNFVIRCAVATGGTGGRAEVGAEIEADGQWADMREVAERYPRNVFLDWRMVDEEVLFAQAAAADFCLFPSKFELDGFLITMGQAMACGAVPIATAQETLSHHRHDRPLSDPAATGFAVPRSFRSDDPRLAHHLSLRIREALEIYRRDRPTYRRLSRNARHLARTFTWERCARQRLAWFARARRGESGTHPDEIAIEYGWFDRLGDDAWRTHRHRIARAAMSRGDIDAYRRCAPVDPAAVARLFDGAYRRADFDRCERLADLVDPVRRRMVRERCVVEWGRDTGSITYRLPHAVQIDLIVPLALSPGVGSGNRYTHPLVRRGHTFVCDLPRDLPATDLVFLLALDNGRIAWDSVPFTRGRRRSALATEGHSC